MKSQVVRRSIIIAGQKTTVSLENAFWTGLKEIAHTRHDLVRPGDDHCCQAATQQSIVGDPPVRAGLLSRSNIGHGKSGKTRERRRRATTATVAATRAWARTQAKSSVKTDATRPVTVRLLHFDRNPERRPESPTKDCFSAAWN
jgi:Ribbon-helix-helix domain